MIWHLVLPLYLKNGFTVLDDIAALFGIEQYASLIFQYAPPVRTRFPGLNRALTGRKRAHAEAHLLQYGFWNGYIQEANNKSSRFLPGSNLEDI